MFLGVRLTTMFSKCGGKKIEKYSLRSSFLFFEKIEYYVYGLINWPNNLVNNVSCKCSLLPHKVREIFLFLYEKEQYHYIESQEYLNSLFSLCVFNLLLCCPTSNFWAVVAGTDSIIHWFCPFIAAFLKVKKSFMRSKGIVPPKYTGDLFLKKGFHDRWVKKLFWAKL